MLQFGLFNLLTRVNAGDSAANLLSETREMVRAAEAIGFDTAWVAEHHFSNYSIVPSPLGVIAHLAACTSTIRLGPAVLVLPFYEPLRLVEDICLTDALCNGRLVLAIGFGYQPREFSLFDVPFDERYSRGLTTWAKIDEGIKTGWVGDVAVAVHPVQQAIETFVVGSDAAVVARAAVVGAIPFVTPGIQPIRAALAARATYAEAFEAAGRSGPEMPLAIQRYVFVSDDAAECRAAAEHVRIVARMAANLRRQAPLMTGAELDPVAFDGEPSLDTIQSGALIGSADAVAERITDEARLLGLHHLSCFMRLGAMPHEIAMKSLERFGADVIPAVMKELR